MTSTRRTANGQIHKDFIPLIDAACAAGWEFDTTSRHHGRLRSPCGQHTVYIAGTPGQRHHRRRLRGELRRAGLDI